MAEKMADAVGRKAMMEIADKLIGSRQEPLSAPPLPIGDLFDDPSVRRRIGKWISQARNRPKRRWRRRITKVKPLRLPRADQPA
jgi:hypothetical protein